jgi:hypothetical protein
MCNLAEVTDHTNGVKYRMHSVCMRIGETDFENTLRR